MGDDSSLIMSDADKMYARRELEFFVEVFAMINDSAVRAFTALFTTEQYEKMDQIVDTLRAAIDAIGKPFSSLFDAYLMPSLASGDCSKKAMVKLSVVFYEALGFLRL